MCDLKKVQFLRLEFTLKSPLLSILFFLSKLVHLCAEASPSDNAVYIFTATRPFHYWVSLLSISCYEYEICRELLCAEYLHQGLGCFENDFWELREP